MAGSVLELKNEFITVVSFAKQRVAQAHILALGMESGHIKIYQFSQGDWQLLIDLSEDVAHHLSVRRLQFRPGKQDKLHLATCGEDHLVRIYNLEMTCSMN